MSMFHSNHNYRNKKAFYGKTRQLETYLDFFRNPYFTQILIYLYCSRVNEAGQLTHTSQAQAITRHVQSPAERRKDIVAQAMQEQKIFEESIPKQEPIVKQEPGVTTDPNVSNSQDNKPLITATKSSPGAGVQGQRKPYQRSSNYNRQQVMPRLTVRYILFLKSRY